MSFKDFFKILLSLQSTFLALFPHKDVEFEYITAGMKKKKHIFDSDILIQVLCITVE